MDRKQEKLLACWKRFEFDQGVRAESGIVCGIDEAGRGPWAGKVYAAAVIFDSDTFIEGLDDSKKIPESKRELLFGEITSKALDYSIGFADVREIEELNILNATFLAMKRAAEGLKTVPALALVDGNRIPPLECRVRTIVKGDSVSASVAAASILAKVSRDRELRELDILYPEFGFASHKGYGTAQHIEALKRYGVTEIHRRSFLKKLEAKTGKLPEYNQGGI